MSEATDLPPAPKWQGVNHLALVTPDMDTTVRFYAGVLGMPLAVAAMAGPVRHYFFEIAPGNTVAFFEVPGAETFAKAAGAPSDRTIQFDHLAFNVADHAELMALRDRLLAAGCEVTEVVDHEFVHSIYFTDPNGIALEASYWVPDAAAHDGDVEQGLVLDPDPVPAVTELQSGGLVSTPVTRLT